MWKWFERIRRKHSIKKAGWEKSEKEKIRTPGTYEVRCDECREIYHCADTAVYVIYYPLPRGKSIRNLERLCTTCRNTKKKTMRVDKCKEKIARKYGKA